VVLGSLIATVLVQAALQINYYPDVWFGDFRFWSTIITALSLCVITSIQYVEHTRSRVSNGVVLFYWLFLLIVYAVKLRSLISQQVHVEHLAYFATFCVGIGLAAIEFALEWLVPKKPHAYEALGEGDECPYEKADVFSVLSFSWMTPMMKYGYKEYLTQDDLWNLRKRDYTAATYDCFEEAWKKQLLKRKPSLWLAMFSGFSGPYFRGAVFKTGSDCLAFVQPQLLRLLIKFVDSYRSDHPQPIIRGAAIALAMFGVSVTQTVCLHQYFQRAFETGMRIKSALTAAIYNKSVKLSNEGRATKSTGDIVNYMAVDTQRLQDLTQYGQQLWSAPLQIFLCMASLYQLVGISMLAGVGAMVVMIPINAIIAKIMKSLQKTQMKNKDARTRLMTEILNNMKSIKLYAWSTAFTAKLNHVRNDQELITLRKIGAAQAFANFTWSTTPFLVSCSTFTVFVLTQDKPLSTDIVFPALTLFNLLTFPLAMLPMVITSIIEASVAVTRLTSFFTAEELQSDAVTVKPGPEKTGEETVRISNATFTWDKYGNRNALEDIDFVARKGELSCVVGRVGMGKSSLLQSILGELWKVKGQVIVRGTSAYVAQTSWVMNASVKENILFGHRYDPEFYDKTVNACALTEDFASLPDGDETEVGERGISLSGGQKARLTLARAVYARADIYLLDDCLSAVDQHVGRHLINEVFGPKGLLSTKTRILATNSIPVLQEADYVYLLRDGRVLEKGTYTELIDMKNGEVTNLIRTANNEEEEHGDEEAKEETHEQESEGQGSSSEEDSDVLIQPEAMEEGQEDNLTELAPIKSAPRQGAKRQNSNLTLRRASTASFQGPRGKLTDEEDPKESKGKQTKEKSEQGKVKWNVYGEYAKTSNLFAVAVYMFTLLGAQTAQVGKLVERCILLQLLTFKLGGSVWLKQWSEYNQKYGGNPNVGKYIGVYFAFGIGSALLVVIQTLILWIFCSIEVSLQKRASFHVYPQTKTALQASRKLHERMATAIFRSPMSFFETTPTGRILNRFSSDIYRVDEVLA